MNLKLPKPGGPKLKVPDVKAPEFLADVYYDLRDRRLLPLVALVVVATIAVPFLLGSDSEGIEVAQKPESESVVSTGAGASLTVVEAQPGLRDYHRRLQGTPSDPFAQKYTGVPAKSRLKSVDNGEGASGAVGTAGGGGAPSSTEGSGDLDGSAPGGSSPPSEADQDGDTGKKGSGKKRGSGGKSKPPRLFEFVLDVQIARSETTPDGRQKMGEPKVRRGVRPLTQLPGKKAPVVTAMGVNLHNGRAMFLISDDVSSLDGDFVCVSRTPNRICELLEIEPGFVLRLVYGPNQVRYRFKVTKIGTVRSGRVGDQRSPKSKPSLQSVGDGSLQDFSK